MQRDAAKNDFVDAEIFQARQLLDETFDENTGRAIEKRFRAIRHAGIREKNDDRTILLVFRDVALVDRPGEIRRSQRAHSAHDSPPRSHVRFS